MTPAEKKAALDAKLAPEYDPSMGPIQVPPPSPPPGPAGLQGLEGLPPAVQQGLNLGLSAPQTRVSDPSQVVTYKPQAPTQPTPAPQEALPIIPVQHKGTGQTKEMLAGRSLEIKRGLAPEQQDIINAGLTAAGDKAAEAANERVQAVEDKAQPQIAAAQHEAAIQAYNQKLLLDHEMRRQNAVADAQHRINDLTDQVANGKIDPDRYVHSMPVWSKIASILAVGLDGALMGATGRSNNIMGRIQKNIDNDIAAQQQSLNSKREGLTAAHNALGQLKEEFGSQRAAIEGLKSIQLQAVKADLDAKLADPNARIDKAAAMQLQAQLLEEIAKTKAAVGKEVSDSVGEARHYKTVPIGTGAPDFLKRKSFYIEQGFSPAEAEKNALRDLGSQQYAPSGVNPKTGGKEDERTVRLPNGQTAVAFDKEAATELRRVQGAANSFRAGVAELQKIRAASGHGALSPQMTARARAIVSSMKDEYPKLLGYNRAPSEGQLDIISDFLPSDPNQFSPSGATDAQLAQVRATVDDIVQNAHQQLLVSPPKAAAPAAPPPASFKPSR